MNVKTTWDQRRSCIDKLERVDFISMTMSSNHRYRLNGSWRAAAFTTMNVRCWESDANSIALFHLFLENWNFDRNNSISSTLEMMFSFFFYIKSLSSLWFKVESDTFQTPSRHHQETMMPDMDIAAMFPTPSKHHLIPHAREGWLMTSAPYKLLTPRNEESLHKRY